MSRQSRGISILTGLGIMLLSCASLYQAAAQSPSGPALPQPAAIGLSQPKPVSLAHLYWHFLVYQNFLDTNAAALQAQGKDGSSMRNHLQARMGFSDADFAPIRASSLRLSSELKVLDSRGATIRAAGVSPANVAQLRALVPQRETCISAEIASLKQSLSHERIIAFETFITQFFAPKPLKVQITPTSGKKTPAAVQP